jgi:hypothetical protein
MARAMTEALWLHSEFGEALFEFIERKASRRKKLLISAEMLTRLADPVPATRRPAPHDLAVVQSLILQEAEGTIPSAFMAVNNHVRVDRHITAAVMGQADYLTRLIEESAGNQSPAELSNHGNVEPEIESLRRSLRTYFANVVRDVIGNPFRSRSFDKRWRTADSMGLARAVYQDRASGRMPLLADALMDAGCADEQIISHCRTGGPHVCGCWVVDLVLGKE